MRVYGWQETIAPPCDMQEQYAYLTIRQSVTQFAKVGNQDVFFDADVVTIRLANTSPIIFALCISNYLVVLKTCSLWFHNLSAFGKQIYRFY